MIFHDWVVKWGISPAAVEDLERRLGIMATRVSAAPRDAKSETAIQAEVRLEAAEKNMYLWRNNVGAGHLVNGAFMRWGLSNDTEALNEVIKSADLIGIRRRHITQEMVGSYIGEFVSREVKKEGWRYDPTNPKHRAQLNWANLIITQGGDAAFVTGKGSL